ncbi:MAG TPA: ATP-dependent DNA helicase, partial [Stackebrandtia sp.]|uniref:ATP-dependent helicase n=1 Tax=Stackebrandtia sp. TaxID=2023065 RepID=UPI002D3F80B7
MRFSAKHLSALLGDPHPPTAQQAAAIEAPLAPGLVVAGAGSGKTATMAARVVWLIANGFVMPSEVLGLTFTRKAAAELASRIRTQLARLSGVDDIEPPVGEPTVSTYHAYASNIVGEHGPRAGLEPGGKVLSAAGAWQLAYAAVRGYDGEMNAVSLTVESVVRRVLSLSDEMSEHLRDGDDVREFTQQLGEEIRQRVGRGTQKTERILTDLAGRLQLLPLVDEYRRRKRLDGAVDFADQLAGAAAVASAAPEVGRIERERYKVVLLDEYQDTSHAQIELLKALYGGGHPVTAVGDPCQSIYAWRGASTGTLARFGTEFLSSEGADARHDELTVSWRNRPEILSVANAISEPLRASGLRVPELESGFDEPGKVVACLTETADDQAAWVADRVEALWTDAGWSRDAVTYEPDRTPPSTAVLVRRRSQITRLEEALRAKGLPVEVIGMGGLLETPEVRELHATLTVLARPSSGPALLRLLTGPRWRIGPRDLAALHARARQLAPERRGFEPSAEGLSEATLAEALDDLGPAERYSPEGHDRFDALRQELAILRTRIDQPVSDLVAEVCRVSGLEVEVLVHKGDSEMLDAFADEAARYTATAALPGLDGFLSYLDAAAERERGLDIAGATEQHGAVQILTIHASKGLEWDVVAVPGLCKGVLPGKTRGGTWLSDTGKLPYPLRGDADQLPGLDIRGVTKAAELSAAEGEFKKDVQRHHEIEERRLAYVALTRARHQLLIAGYWWDEAEQPRGPSVFLEEATAAGAYVDGWCDEPGESNPLLETDLTARWPDADPLGPNQMTVAAAAGAVRASDGALADFDEAKRWAEEAELLLAERAERERPDITVPVPNQLSVSQLVAWHADAQEFARGLRRPVPQAPAPHTRRGTAFHAWVENRLGGATLFDLDELPGSADTPETDERLAELQEAFAASAWAQRAPVAIEVPFVTVLNGVVIRGRMDAVFGTDDGFEVVDWKTGRPPRGAAARSAAVQLAAYRQAWAAMRGIDP